MITTPAKELLSTRWMERHGNFMYYFDNGAFWRNDQLSTPLSDEMAVITFNNILKQEGCWRWDIKAMTISNTSDKDIPIFIDMVREGKEKQEKQNWMKGFLLRQTRWDDI